MLHPMSTMMNPPTFGSELTAPTRTSLAAIFALIFGLLGLITCCVPFVGTGLGLLALLLGVISMVAISAARGGLTGRGVAITGIVTGLIGVVVSIFVFAGIMFATKAIEPYAQVAQAAAAKDLSGVTPALDMSVVDKVTPETLATFANEVEGAIGAGATFHTGIFDMFNGGKIMGTQAAGVDVQAQYRGHNVIPIYAKGSTRNAAVLLVTNSGSPDSTYKPGKLLNLVIIPEGTSDAFYLVPLHDEHN